MMERIKDYLLFFSCQCGNEWYQEANDKTLVVLCPRCNASCGAYKHSDLVKGDKRYSRKRRALRLRKELFGV